VEDILALDTKIHECYT